MSPSDISGLMTRVLRRAAHPCRILVAGALLGIGLPSGCAYSSANRAPIPQHELQPFVAEMVRDHGFSRPQLDALFAKARILPGVLAAMQRPAEALPWYRYRAIFLTPSRIQGGAVFWDRYADILQRAQQRYGVPPQIVTGIIGVETRYGSHVGTIPVLDSLTTLAFDYPPRSAFFRSELAQFLLLTRDNHLDPLAIKGSYAGAMGMPQFISSSYRRYAVDFDGDGRRDLLNSPADAIGSVANYLNAHGWTAGAPVAVRVRVSGDRYQDLLKNNDPTPRYTLAELSNFGVVAADPAPQDQPVALLRLKGPQGDEYWAGFHNFYVITRYNHSALYAMAVFQLSREIRAARDRRNP
ncbi:MAG TPA: lytic murein transglycosylase B [Gammaproteobacteria bacterium]|nr:lytic murein transglycosylase B [Gammaproteobacteria bacterium]